MSIRIDDRRILVDCTLLLRREPQMHVPMDHIRRPEAVQKPDKAAEAAVAEEPAETPQPEEPMVASEPVNTEIPPGWYVVAGCFEIESNADNLVTHLKNKGFNARKVGVIGNLYMVCFDSFDNRQDALKLLREVRWETEPDAWMVRY